MKNETIKFRPAKEILADAIIKVRSCVSGNVQDGFKKKIFKLIAEIEHLELNQIELERLRKMEKRTIAVIEKYNLLDEDTAIQDPSLVIFDLLNALNS